MKKVEEKIVSIGGGDFKIDRYCIDFYQEMNSVCGDSFSQVDLTVLFQLAKQYVAKGENWIKVKILISHAKTIKNVYGDEIFQYLFMCEKTGIVDWKIFHAFGCELVNIAHVGTELAEEVRRFLLREKIIDFNKINPVLVDLRKAYLSKKYPEKSIEKVIEDFSEKTNSLLFPMEKHEINLLVVQYKKLQKFEIFFRELSNDGLKQEVQKIKAKMNNKNNVDARLETLALAREAVRRIYKIFPYNTQMLAVLGLLNVPEDCHGRLAQVRTGEGKSTIIALLAMVLAMEGKKVHVVTSSGYLAERDQKKYLPFFQMFGFTCTHICDDLPTEVQLNGDIVHGTSAHYAFVYLRSGLFFRPDFPCRDVRIYDEVDSMFVDRAGESARIAIENPNDISSIIGTIVYFFKEKSVSFLEKMYAEGKIDENIGTAYEEALQKTLQGAINPQLLAYFFSEPGLYIKTKKAVILALVGKKLKVDYVIKDQEKIRGGRLVKAPSITIVDHLHTGQTLDNSQWQDGIHQALEAKEGLPMSEMTLTGASISNAVDAAAYKQVFGVTGTLGGPVEIQELKEGYNLSIFCVPTHLPNQRTRYEPTVLGSRSAYLAAIIEAVKYQAFVQRRPVLIIAKTIEKADLFANGLKEMGIQPQLLNGIQTEDSEYLISKAGDAGAKGTVTVATNYAGRGTDILLTPDAVKNGGLHVILTFLPSNERVREQAAGRAARQGNPGSEQIILDSTDPDIEAYFDFSVPEGKTLYEYLIEQREEKNQITSQERQWYIQKEKMIAPVLSQFFEKLKFWQKELDKKTLEILGRNILLEKAPKIDTPDKQYDDFRMRWQSIIERKSPNVDDVVIFLVAFRDYVTTTLILPQWAIFYTKLHEKLAQLDEVALTKFEKTIWESLGGLLDDPVMGFYALLREKIGCRFKANSFSQNAFQLWQQTPPLPQKPPPSKRTANINPNAN